ncbi:hypothetical protein AAMO2058_001244000 [Amorphochlora amoebiformis]
MRSLLFAASMSVVLSSLAPIRGSPLLRTLLRHRVTPGALRRSIQPAFSGSRKNKIVRGFALQGDSKAQNTADMEDYSGDGDNVLRVMSDSAEVSCLVADTTQLVAEAQKRHNLSITATVALGRALTGGLLLAAFKAEGDAVQLKFSGRGPLGEIMVIANNDGNVRGRISNPTFEVPPREDGTADIKNAVGKGALEVVRSNNNPYMPFYKPYTGVVPINSGEIAEDIAYYLAASEQTSSAIGLGVVLNPDGTVKKAGGWHIQVLPMASDETLVTLECNIQNLGSTTELLANGVPTLGISQALLSGLADIEKATFSLKPKYGPCEETNLEERMMRAIAALGKEEAVKLLDENDGIVEIRCDFCAHTKQFDREEIMTMLEEVAAKGK